MRASTAYRASMALLLALLLAACASTVTDAGLEGEPLGALMVAAEVSETTSELAGSTVSGSVFVFVESVGWIAEVRFYVDGLEFGRVGASPFGVDLDTTTLADGPHQLRVEPRMKNGRVRDASDVTFLVDNATEPAPPTVDPDPQDPDPQDPGPKDPEDPPPGDGGEDPVDPDPTDPGPSDPPIAGVRIAVGSNAGAVIASHPAGTTFVFEPGVHRLTAAIRPRAGDAFVGEDGAVLSGAKELTQFDREGGLWFVSGQTQQVKPHGDCTAAAPRCDRPEDLFFDDVPLLHVAARGDVGPGTWFFDYGADRIYVYDDPTGRRVETSWVDGAIVGDADDVTVRNLTVEKFATRAQRAAVFAVRYASAVTYGANWVIEDNLVRLNHGVGISAGHGSTIRNNRVLMNGQLGVGSSTGHGTLIEGNEIAYNNFAGFDHSWEGGGTKFANTTGLVVRNNHVHHNVGPGLWTDIDNVDTLYEYNVVESNTHTGIFHEISYDAVIRYNTVTGNGFGRGFERYCYVHCAGIFVYNSANVSVYGNTVLDNWNGITARYGNRGAGAFGTYALENLYVYDNVISMGYHPDGVGPGGERGVTAVTGVVRDGSEPVFEASSNIRFEGNAYSLEEERHFMWLEGQRTFSDWQSYGFDEEVLATGAY